VALAAAAVVFAGDARVGGDAFAGAAYYHNLVVADGAVAYWRLDETSGTTAADQLAKSPGTYNAVTLNQPSAMLGEYADASASLNGASSSVVAPDTSALDQTSAVTIELWAKRRAISNTYQVLAGKPGNGQSKFENYALWINSANNFQAYFGNGATYIHVETAPVTDTNWHYVVATYDGATARIYLDGKQASQTKSTLQMAANANPLNIGRANSGGSFFNGWLDDVAIYPTALTATQIANHYAAATAKAAPVVSLTAPAGGSYKASSTVTFSGVAGAAPGDSANVTVNVYAGSSASGTPAQTLAAARQADNTYSVSTALADGTWTAQAVQADSSGNTGLSSANTFTVDTVAPVTTIVSGPANPSITASATFSFAAGEPASFQCSLDGAAYSACTSPQSYYALATTSHTFRVRATDAAGNVGAAASYTWTVQAAPVPPPSIDSAPANPANSASATFAFSDTAAGVTFRCSLDGSAYAACSTPAGYAGLSDTSHTFSVQAVDPSSGNTSAPTTATWAIDTKAPVVTLTSPASGSSRLELPTFTGVAGTAAGDSGSVTVNVYAGSSASGSPVQAPTTLAGANGGYSVLASAPLQAGTYTAQAVQKDAAGNAGTSAVTTFTVGDPVILSAGDIAGCLFTVFASQATGAKLATVPDALVVPLGDNAYPDGQPSEYQNCYGSTWGPALARTRPVVGEHDETDRTSTGGSRPGVGYVGYFQNQLAPFGPTATDLSKLYYSYDLGAWHVVVLNDSCIERQTPNCDEKAQEAWLKNDLATHPSLCTLALYHEPRYSSGNIHGDLPPIEAFWNILYQYGVDLVLNGSDHDYERFAPQDAAGNADPAYGIREIIVGTGGYGLYSLGTVQPNSEVYDSTTYGVLKTTLHPTGYDWQFLAAAGGSFTDSGSGSCHPAPPAPPPAVPSVRTTTQAYANNATSLTVAKPAGAVAGDLLLAIVAHQGGTAADITPPAGWQPVPDGDYAESTNARIHAYYRIADALEPSSYTFALVGTPQDMGGAILDIGGANAAAPIDGAAGQVTAENSEQVIAPSVTTDVPNTLLVYGGALNIAGVFEPPPFMVEQAEGSTSGTYTISLEVATRGFAASGATGDAAGYVTFNSGRSAAFAIAIAPQ
jgi:hypothetical protein